MIAYGPIRPRRSSATLAAVYAMATPANHPGILQRLASLLGAGPRHRYGRVYCAGAPRTGTHSLAAVFARPVRSAHEPKLRAAMKALVAHAAGEQSFDGLRTFVRERDARLRLDIDSSHVNAYLAEALVAEFDDARFLLTMRDCYSWLDLALNHTMNTGSWSEIDRRYLEFWFGTLSPDYSKHDAFLKEHRLLSVDCYLDAWARHNQAVLQAVPADRLLVVRTEEIAERLHDIADFAEIPRQHLARGFRAQGQAKAKHGLLERIDRDYLEERVTARCGEIMRRFFPDATLRS